MHLLTYLVHASLTLYPRVLPFWAPVTFILFMFLYTCIGIGLFTFLYISLPFSLCQSGLGRIVYVCNQLSWLSLCVYLTVCVLVHISFCFSVTRLLSYSFLFVLVSVCLCVIGYMSVHMCPLILQEAHLLSEESIVFFFEIPKMSCASCLYSGFLATMVLRFILAIRCA